MERPIPKLNTRRLVSHTRGILAWISFAITLAIMVVLCASALMPRTDSAALSGSVGDKIDDFLTETGSDTIKHVEPESIKILDGKKQIQALELACGASKQLSCTFIPTDTSVEFRSLEWASGDAKIATVQGGKVTARTVGTTTVTATVAGKKSVTASVKITVKEVAATSVTLAFSNGAKKATLEKNRHISLDAAVLPSNATNKSLTYRSENSAIATVDKNGLITAVAPGTVKLFAEHAVSGKTLSASVELKVIEEETEYVALRSIAFPETGISYVGDKGKLSVNFSPADSTEKTLVYKSSDSSVLRVNSATGEYEMLKRGDATVTATYALDKTIAATAQFHVRNRALNATLTFEGTKNAAESGYSLTLSAGQRNVKLNAKAAISPVYVRYETSDAEVAEVFEDGTIATYRSSQQSEGGIVRLRVLVSDNPDFSGENGDLCTAIEVKLTVSRQPFSDGIKRWGTMIRKALGHFGAFSILGFFAALTAILFDNGSDKRRIIFAIILIVGGFAFAGLTEFFQTGIFTVGRNATMSDVVLDYCGYLPVAAGMYFIFVIAQAVVLYIKKRRRERPRE